MFASVHLPAMPDSPKRSLFFAVILPVVLCMWFSVLGVCSFL